MNYPVQKSDDEWRAVLSKGTSPIPLMNEGFMLNQLRTIPCHTRKGD